MKTCIMARSSRLPNAIAQIDFGWGLWGSTREGRLGKRLAPLWMPVLR